MDFHIGAPVLLRDGDKIGEVKHVIVDPDTREVVEMVVGESGLLGREVLVPIGAVDRAEEDGVRLELGKDQVDQLQDFVTTRYIAPPPTANAGGGLPVGALYPQPVPPIGAATGLESIGYVPLVEEVSHIPEGDVDLQPGTDVWATDGKIGSVNEVLYDDQTNRLRGFVVKEGIIFHRDVEISIDDVAEITSDRVTLKLSKDEVEKRGS